MAEGLDAALRRRQADDDPVRVGVIGAGFMGRAVVRQIATVVPGMVVAAVANRHADAAISAYADAGAPDPRVADGVRGIEAAVAGGHAVVTEDATALGQADGIDVVFEVTGAVAFGADVVLEAIAHGKHVVTMNAELDGTIGPLLKARADAAGVVYSASDGDQPGVQGNLHAHVARLGLRPLLMGNVKGLHDPRRTPATQAEFAARWGQRPEMVTSFADGTKIAFEQATVANAFGFTVLERGMTGRDHDGHVDELTTAFDADVLSDLGGVVDYVVGAQPSPGVFCLAAIDADWQRERLDLYKLGPGPLYSFYAPHHLCHFEAPASIARAALFGEATLAPAGALTVEVVTTAKTALDAGTVLDGLGGFHTYGLAERADATRAGGLLPIGVAEGCTLRRAVPQDAVMTYDDVELPPGRRLDQLRAELTG